MVNLEESEVSEEGVLLNMKPLENLLKALKRTPAIHIGVLGGKNARDDGKSNAMIGACHEHGTSTTPMRSFLRIPLADNLERRMKRAGALDKDVLLKIVNTGTLRPWIEKVAILAEGIVLEAFDTGGFGKWPPSDFSRKKNHQTLVETQQLRNSISSEVIGA